LVKFAFKKTSGQQNLTIELCKELPLPLPSYPEQQKIAQILSTWDKAIEKLEALIAAKQKRKNALMQQLLTGKKRVKLEGHTPSCSHAPAWEHRPAFDGEVCIPTRERGNEVDAHV